MNRQSHPLPRASTFRPVLVVVLITGGAAHSLYAAAGSLPATREPAPSVAMKDVKGREVAVPAGGKVLLLTFASRSNTEGALAISRAAQAAHPEVEHLVFLDMGRVPGFVRGRAKERLLAQQARIVRDTRDALLQAGKTPPADLDAHIHLIPDWDRKAFKTFGVGGKEAQFVVVGPDGTIQATFPKAPNADALKSAVGLAFR